MNPVSDPLTFVQIILPYLVAAVGVGGTIWKYYEVLDKQGKINFLWNILMGIEDLAVSFAKLLAIHSKIKESGGLTIANSDEMAEACEEFLNKYEKLALLAHPTGDGIINRADVTKLLLAPPVVPTVNQPSQPVAPTAGV